MMLPTVGMIVTPRMLAIMLAIANPLFCGPVAGGE
jgi:hypothetical protein